MRAWPILLLAVACSPAGRASDPVTEPPARRATVVAPAYTVTGIDVEGDPPRFVVTLTREMSTPGWKLIVDDLEVDAATRRIVARVTERGPGGVTAQVITPTRLRIDVGPIAGGRWLLAIHGRRGDQRPYRLDQALVLNAR